MAETPLLGSPVSGAAGAVGPQHILSMQETEIHVQSRAGASVQRQTLDSWWQSRNTAFANADVSQPRVIFDPASQRWIAIVAAQVVPESSFDPRVSALLLAVSQGADPTGAWHSWRFDMPAIGSSGFTPSIQSLTLGFNRKWIAVGAFLLDTHHRESRHRTLVFSKSTALAGAVLSYRSFEDADSTSITPVQTYDESQEKLYLVQTWNANAGGSGYLRVMSIQGEVGNETLSQVGYPSAPAWAASDTDTDSFFGNAPQSGGSDLIATYDDRVQSAVCRDGSIWIAQTVFLPVANPNRSSVQWWKIDAPSAVVQQRGLIDDPAGARSHAFPSLAVNAARELFVAYNAFSGTAHPGAYGRVFVPSAGGYAPMPEIAIKQGEAYYLKDARVNPWGPASVACLDPANPGSFWSLQQYSVPLAETTGAWGTWWGSVAPAGISVNPLDAWRGFHGLPDDGSLDLDSASDDGVSNLVKYALNISPNSGDLGRSGNNPLANPNGITLADLSGMPVATREPNGRLSLTYLRRKTSSSPGVVYETLFGDEMGRWAMNPAALESVTRIDDTWERVKVTDSFSAGQKKVRFVRLKVSVSFEFEGGF